MRLPKQKANTIIVSWGKTKDSSLDLHTIWGSGVAVSDARLAIFALSPLFNELIKRGYNPHSFKFQVSKL